VDGRRTGREGGTGDTGGDAAPPEDADDGPVMARVFDHWVGGTDHLDVDREFAREAERVLPAAGELCRDVRTFSWRAVEHLCRAGYDQFLELGSGLPTVDHVHTHAARHHPGRRVVYVDRDAAAVREARRLLAGTEGVEVLRAEIADTAAVLGSPEVAATLDLRRPVAVLAVAILVYLDDDGAAATAAGYRGGTAPGSALVVSHVTGIGRPDLVAWSEHEHSGRSYAPFLRDPEQMTSWFDGHDLVGPGWCSAPHWVPDGPAPSPAETGSGQWGAVGIRR
jgi:S-adenosyl methyltransferase